MDLARNKGSCKFNCLIYLQEFKIHSNFQDISSLRVALFLGAHFLKWSQKNPMFGVEEYGIRLKKIVLDLESFNVSVRTTKAKCSSPKRFL